MASHENLRLNRAAVSWNEAFPLGNGTLGAMVFCAPCGERVALNHENLWRDTMRKTPADLRPLPRKKHLEEVRRLLFNREWAKAAKLTNEKLCGSVRVQPYQPLADLNLHTGHSETNGYTRRLRLADGTAEVNYFHAGVAFQREYFVSAVRGVVVIRITADKASSINCSLDFTRAVDPECRTSFYVEGRDACFTGVFDEGIHFASRARIFTRGENARLDPGGGVPFEKADELMIIISAATDYESSSPPARCEEILDKTPVDFEILRSEHLAEHRKLFSRVSIELGGGGGRAGRLPLDERLEALRRGAKDPGLYATLFNFGRYIMMSGSRFCRQPLNLQGIWNQDIKPAWDADFHHDINIQECYWPTEVCNLCECAEPLFSYLKRIIPEARRAAKTIYGCRGIFIPMATDIWARTFNEAKGWGGWTGAAAWLSQHLWWRYEFNPDEDFLREDAYPFMKLAAEFYEDFLVRDESGRLVTAPSQSPENWFKGGGRPVSLSVCATMDILLVRELLDRCIKSARILAVDSEKTRMWQKMLEDLPPLRAGRFGQLMEWLEDFEEGEPHHRHLSHLLGVFPGDSMTFGKTPGLMKPAMVSLERRLEAAGWKVGMQFSWSRNWAAALWARFFDGERAFQQVEDVLRNFVTVSLNSRSRRLESDRGDAARVNQPIKQPMLVEGNLGATAAIAEMLMQSHEGFIRLLPALPEAWPDGRVRGLRARGGFEVDIAWKGGRLREAKVKSLKGLPCRIALSRSEWAVQHRGLPVKTRSDVEQCLCWPAENGKTYTVLRMKF